MSEKKRIRYSSPVSLIPGIGPKREKALVISGIRTAGDLLNWLPRRYLDRSTVTSIANLREGENVTVEGTVLKTAKIRRRKSFFKVTISDETGFLTGIWFRGIRYIASRFQNGQKVRFSGKTSFYNGFQITHPDVEFDIEADAERMPVLPVYSTPQSWVQGGFDSRLFRKWVRWALENAAVPPSMLPASIREREKIQSQRDLHQRIHFPPDIQSGLGARRDLQFGELYLLAYALQKRKAKSKQNGRKTAISKKIQSEIIKNLPFKLTAAQERVLEEIRADAASAKRMNRLIQGDVGSGKTLVALLTMCHYIESGMQTALMAPTEILARQHLQTLRGFFSGTGVTVECLTGKQSAQDRRRIETELKNGSIHVIIGTHALLSEPSVFHDLGLVIIDEQHRFGVEQRLTLVKKGNKPDVLVMSATPIPRTVALVVYGDLDISVVDEKPPGRRDVMTRMIPEGKRKSMYQFIREKIGEDRRVYVILPLVEESEKQEDVAAAVETADEYRRTVFRDIPVGLLHGRMKNEDKQDVMEKFKSGETPILVSTTVVEVGMDVKEAGVMVIEHAERFGLSQLHQLRGRVGRGDLESFCFLMTSADISEESSHRLRAFCATNDGFKIAEKDLEIRGPGDITGLRQSGFSSFMTANPFLNPKLFNKANQYAEQTVSRQISVSPEERKRLDQESRDLLKRLQGGAV